MSYNPALYNLYESRLANLFDKLKEHQSRLGEISSPLLLSIENEQHHKSADLRIMIFGQETSSWFKCLNETPLEKLTSTGQEIYYDFYYKHKRGYEKVKKSPFHNFRDQLRNCEKLSNKKISYVVNNLYKFGKSRGSGRAPDWFLDLEKAHFNIIQEEVRLLEIDLCIFLTGPNYDNRIREIFGTEDVTLSKFEEGSGERSIARVDAGEITGIRIYHPAYLRRKGLEKGNRAAVVQFILSSFPKLEIRP